MLKKKVVFLLSLVFLFSINFQTAKAQDLSVSAKSAIVICADSGAVVFSKNESEKLSMASTTKIMTALLTIEASQAENKQIEITQEMVAVEGSSMGLRAGNIVTLDTLAKGMLMCSGNDAANSAAIAIAGSSQAFSDLMNQRAKQIGMVNTNFVTPSGLDDTNHYSTAYDMALLGAYAMENQNFIDIASQKSMTVDFISPTQRRSYANHNRLITLYKGCIGIKTGFTKKSGRCLVSCAQRDGVRLVAVTLNAPDDWKDHSNMFDYCFLHVQRLCFDDTQMNYSQQVVGSESESVIVKAAFPVETTVKTEDAQRVIKRVELPNFSYAPIRQGQIIGSMHYEIDGNPLVSVNLIATSDIEQKKNTGFWEWLKSLIGF